MSGAEVLFGEEKRNYRKEALSAVLYGALYFVMYKTHAEIGLSLALGAYSATLTTKKGFLFQTTAFLLVSAFFTSGFPWAVLGAFVIAPATAFAGAKMKEKGSKTICLVLLCLSQIAYILVAKGGQQIAERILGLPVSVGTALCISEVLRETDARGMRFIPQGKLLLSVCVSVGLIAGGIERTTLFGTSLSCLFAPALVLFTARVFGREKAMLTAFCVGTGCALFSGDVTGLALWQAVGAVVALFDGKKVSALASAGVIVAFGCLWGSFAENILFTVTGALSSLSFLLWGGKFLSSVKSRIITNEKTSSAYVINRRRDNLSGRLFELSEVFFALSKSFKAMVRGVMPAEKAVETIICDVSERVCGNCNDRVRCWRTMRQDTQKGFDTVTRAALDKGRATVIDVNNSLVARCGRITSVIAEVNAQADAYKRYYAMTINSDNGKSLIAEQMMGVSTILSKLVADSRKTVFSDESKDRKISERLSLYGILCKEATLIGDGNDFCVLLVADSGDVKKKGFSERVSEAVGLPLMIDKVENAEEEGWKVVHFVPRPTYDVTFGFACEKKSGSDVSGDTHSFLKIDSGRFLLALCDGMGSGKEAEEASSRAVSMVENFYKAGFDNDTVLSGVNRLLSSAGDDRFTAVDIALIDLRNGLADFIKIGSPAGLIRQRNGAEFIDGGSLPMGVLDEMRPVITKKALSEGDCVYLFSDGTELAFSGKQNLGAFVSSLEKDSPQEQADAIMERALSLCREPKDDMTVIVAKLVKSRIDAPPQKPN